MTDFCSFSGFLSYLWAALGAIYVNMSLSFPSFICCHHSEKFLQNSTYFRCFQTFHFTSKHFFLTFILFIPSSMLLITYRDFLFLGLVLVFFLDGCVSVLSWWFSVCHLICFFCPRVISAAGADRRRAQTWHGDWEAVRLLTESCSLRRWRGVKDEVLLPGFTTDNDRNRNGKNVTICFMSSV